MYEGAKNSARRIRLLENPEKKIPLYNTRTGKEIFDDWAVQRAVFLAARNQIKYKGDKYVDRIVHRFHAENDGLIPIEIFLYEKTGVCRHSTLAAGALVERFIIDDLIDGKVSVDRNSQFPDAHSWVRRTTSDSRIFVMDPINNILGTLEQALKKGKWDYRRPEDSRF